MKTVLNQIIERDKVRLKTLLDIYSSENPIVIIGFKEEVISKITELIHIIHKNQMLLDAERQQTDSAFKRGISARKKSSFRYRHYF